MSIKYLVDKKVFDFDYKTIRSRYEYYVNATDHIWMDELPQILHLCCIISYFKGFSAEELVSDCGIIHQLAHLMTIPDDPVVSLFEIRLQFNAVMKLA